MGSLNLKTLLAAAVVTALAFGGFARQAAATSVFTGSGTASDGTATKAEVDFDVVGSTLTVVLKNTSTVITSQPALLMGVYWSSNSLTGSTLSSVSSNGSTILNGAAAGAGWFGYGLGDTGFSDLNGKHGVAASAWGFGTEIGRLGVDGSSPGTPNSLDGPSGGLTSTLGTSSGKTVLQTSVKYNIDISGVSGFNANAFLASINNVVFTYGTGESDYRTSTGNPPPGGTPNTPVPVPAAAWTGMALLAGMGAVAKHCKKLSR